MISRSHRALIALTLATSCGSALGATAAYWRHEEGVNGGLIPAGPNTVLDSSGNGNHMQTFDPSFTSGTYTNSVSPLPLRSGLPNTLAIDFGPGGDDGGNNDDNYSTPDKLVNGQIFTAMTIEIAFKMDTISGYQAVFGKDGKPLGDALGEDDSPVPPFKIMVRGDDFPGAVPNQLFVEWIDGDGTLFSDIHFLSNHETVVAGTWYHVAFTLNADTAELWVAKGTAPYTKVDSKTGQDYAGTFGQVLVDEPLGFTIGRGMFGNGVTDWADAVIDEARISDTILTPDQFLFLAGGTRIPGDTNGDGVVDLGDLNNVLNNFGATGASPGDDNGDGVVDLEDLNRVLNNFGDTAAASALSVVPEPATVSLLAVGAVGLLARSRRRN